jgi:short-subunit dehydrogenase
MKRLILITGASRGIGHSLAIETFKKYTNDTLFILMSRDEIKLKETQNEMRLLNDQTSNEIKTIQIDFSQNSSVDNYIQQLTTNVDQLKTCQFDQIIIFYNHGTLLLGKVEEVADKVSNEFQINVTSVWCLMAALRQLFPIDKIPSQFHINISTLNSTRLLNDFSSYSASKCHFYS